MSLNAEEYIEQFRNGSDFSGPSRGLTSGSEPDPGALKVLARALKDENASVRENVVELLVDLARQTEPLTEKGAEVIKNREIIALLAGPGISKVDLGRDASLDALRKMVTRADLEPFAPSFARTLEDSPSDDAFLLVAKTKFDGARPIVEKVARTPDWENEEAAKIARAALGAEDVEQQFIDEMLKFESEKDAESMSFALGTLGLIGTEKSLRTVAERIRTPIVFVMTGRFERSVRLNVMEALLYNFPDRPELYPNNVNQDSDYEKAERFCVQQFGIKLTEPRPPFMTIKGYPI